MKSKVIFVLIFLKLVFGFLPRSIPKHKIASQKIKSPFNILKCSPLTTPQVQTEKFAFESNVARVMDIIINSLYSNKDVFIRELISNAADACDKKRFVLVEQQPEAPDLLTNLKIRVIPNREANTLTIEDSGVGMSKEDMIQNLGRIAESGTKKFADALGGGQKDAVSLIGQFGVGFYSAFLVADRVTVQSRKEGGEAYRWEADAQSLNSYSITPESSLDLLGPSGTRVVLHLKEECDQYLDDVAVKALIEKYSEFTPFPIELQRVVSKPESIPDTSKPPEPDGTLPMRTIMKKTTELQVVNGKQPLWLRPPRECSEEDYTLFYQQTFAAQDTPLAHAHFSVEGNVDFKALLFLPTDLPYELSRDMFASSARSFRLYVKRVFINDKFEDLIPRWLLFMRGVVDSEDLPLNVGREILQQSRALRIIKQRLVKKSVDMMNDLAANDPDKFLTFWKNFGKYLKIGIIEDDRVRPDLLPLCRFHSSHAGGRSEVQTTLPEYVSRMPQDQRSIYYSVGESVAQAAMNPTLEGLRKKGHEVLFVADPLDEITLQNIGLFAGKQIVDVGKEKTGAQELSEAERSEKMRKNEGTEGLRHWMKGVLGSRVQRVEASTRLVDSPATIVQSEYGVSPSMQKFLRAQTMAGEERQQQLDHVLNQAVLEINPDHPIILHLQREHALIVGEGKDSSEAKEIVEMLLNTAALQGGYMLENAALFAKSVTKLMSKIV